MAVEETVVVAAGPTTVTVESGAFTVSSTVGQVITKQKMDPNYFEYSESALKSKFMSFRGSKCSRGWPPGRAQWRRRDSK
jgi:hypothetical protein